MAGQNAHVWVLARQQHGVVTREQLLSRGFTRHAIDHRITKGRLHPLWRGVYAVGRPEVSAEGRLMAAVLACGEGAAVSHASAAGHFGFRPLSLSEIHVSVPTKKGSCRPGIVVHRRRAFDETHHLGIPVTTPAQTLIDLAARLDHEPLEAAINEADKLDLTTPDELRAALDSAPPTPGLAALRKLLDRRTFTMTDSELERRFRPIAWRAGLTQLLTRRWVNGYRVDFYEPELGLVIETDGLRYHRTPAQQAIDRVRDQVHTAAGLTPLRFTRAQVRFAPEHVESILAAVAKRLAISPSDVRDDLADGDAVD